MRKIIVSLVLLTIAQFATNAYGLSCFPCGSYLCERPFCCNSGEVERLDSCDCCPRCAKAKAEKCGGNFGTGGTCASGLSCLRKCPDSEKDTLWKDWCDKDYLANVNGECVNNTEKENPPTQTHVFTDGLDTGESIITCDAFEQEHKGKTCFCTSVPSGFDLPGENCTGDKLNVKGWCFLENVKSVSNPSQGCFKDAYYSERWGRFYSVEACQSAENYKDEKLPLPPVVDLGLGEDVILGGAPGQEDDK